MERRICLFHLNKLKIAFIMQEIHGQELLVRGLQCNRYSVGYSVTATLCITPFDIMLRKLNGPQYYMQRNVCLATL